MVADRWYAAEIEGLEPGTWIEHEHRGMYTIGRVDAVFLRHHLLGEGSIRFQFNVSEDQALRHKDLRSILVHKLVGASKLPAQ
jgi:hypothetical protein